MTKAIVYSRVSTDAQERDGTSLETQERACIEHAERQGWRVVRAIRDHVSGAVLERDGLSELRAALLHREADVVVAYAVDRLSRNQNHIGILFDEFEGTGTRLELVTERFEDTAVGRFVLAARAFVAEVEREKIAERTMRGKAERARTGRLPQGTGQGFYGYRYEASSGTRIVDEVQARVVRDIFDTFVFGGSCHGIAQRLNHECVPAFNGGQWYALTIRRVLLNETYTGRTVYRRTRVQKVRDAARNQWVRRVVERDASDWIEVEGATPAIITTAQFAAAQAILADPARRNRSVPSHEYALRGRIRCAECGSAMVGHAVNRARYHYYRCANGSSGPGETLCRSRYVRVERIEDAVRSALADLLASPERLLDEARRLASPDETVNVEAVSLARELDEVVARQRRLAQLFTRGELPEDILAEQSKALAERRAVLEAKARAAEVKAARSSRFDAARIERDLPCALGVVRGLIESAGPEKFALLLRAVDVEVSASSEAIEIRGAVPLIAEPPQSFATIERTWA
jgi:site-specific DNA recombinase